MHFDATSNVSYRDFIASATNTYALGSAGVRWSNGYFTGIDVTTITTANSTNLADLTTAEISQLLNIGGTTIALLNWQYLAAMNQSVSSLSNVTFANLIVSGAINTGNSTNLADLTTAEITQLLNINATTISTTNWTNVATLNQALSSSSSPTFATLTVSTGITTVNSTNLGSLTTAEITQLLNINATTITTTNWTNVATLNQALGSTSNPTFNNLTISTTLTTANSNNLASLTTSEISQLMNIGSLTIPLANWTYLAGMNQGVASSGAPSFAGMTLTGTLTGRNVIPSANNTYTCGSISSKWAFGYFIDASAEYLTILDGQAITAFTIAETLSTVFNSTGVTQNPQNAPYSNPFDI
jgi:hypothetical protein